MITSRCLFLLDEWKTSGTGRDEVDTAAVVADAGRWSQRRAVHGAGRPGKTAAR